MMATFQIFRFDPDKDASPRIDTFPIDTEKGDTILDCLDRIRSRHDSSIAFRSSCLHAVCGSCAVRVNGKPVLACQTQVSRIMAEHSAITVEPLRNFRIIRDLVVDLTPLFRQLNGMMPWWAGDNSATPMPGSTGVVERTAPLDAGWECIMCASCYSECSQYGVNRKFYGPAALVAAYRYTLDRRDSISVERIARLAGRHGVWECVRCYECTDICTQKIKHHRIINALSELTDRRRSCRHAGARHARAFISDIARTGKLNEPLLALRTAGLKTIAYVCWTAMMLWKGKLSFRLPASITGIDDLRELFRAIIRDAE